MTDIVNKNLEIIDSWNIPIENINISKTQDDIKENLEDTNLGKTLYDLRKREKNGTIYKYMWIEWFRKLILHTAGQLNSKIKFSYDGKPLKRYAIPSYDEKWLEAAIVSWKNAEAVHIMWSIFCAIWMTWFMLDSGNIIGWVNLFLFLINFYLTILQRYNRWKIMTVLQKKKEHNKSKTDSQ